MFRLQTLLTTFSRRPSRARTALAAMWIVIIAAVSAQAQERPSPALDVTAGWVGFADDGVVHEALIGSALRWYLTPRVAIGPEAGLIRGTDHHHLVLTGNVTWDVVTFAGGRVTPFVVAGGGLFQTSQTFAGGTFTSREGAFTAGGGVRVRAGTRVTAGVDARIGWEPHLRIAGLIGVRLRR